MKKILFLLPLAALMLLSACSKKDEAYDIDAVQKKIISAVSASAFDAGSGLMSVPALVPGMQKAATANSGAIGPVDVKDSLNIGKVTLTGNYTINIGTNSFSSDVFLKSVYTNYTISCEGKNYAINGTVNSKLNMSISSAQQTPVINATSGTLVISGNSYNKSVNINLTTALDSSKGLYTVTGTINGANVSFTYSK